MTTSTAVLARFVSRAFSIDDGMDTPLEPNHV
jgi:hypothetical protein